MNLFKTTTTTIPVVKGDAISAVKKLDHFFDRGFTVIYDRKSQSFVATKKGIFAR